MRSILMVAGSLLIAAELASAAVSQGAPKTIATSAVDPKSLAAGYRTTRLVGSPVVNDAGETVGTVDDLIVAPGGKACYAVLSVGGFLGEATRFVIVSTTAFDVTDNHLVLHGATNATLVKLPSFAYSE